MAGPRERLDPILDECWEAYLKLGEEKQVAFKGGAKAFVRTYDFLGSALTFTRGDWEELSILLNLLIPRLPAPAEEDLSLGDPQGVQRPVRHLVHRRRQGPPAHRR